MPTIALFYPRDACLLFNRIATCAGLAGCILYYWQYHISLYLVSCCPMTDPYLVLCCTRSL